MGALDALIFGYRKIYAGGAELPNRGDLEVIGGTVTDNPTTGRTELLVAGVADTGVASGALALYDVVTSANDPTTPSKITKATTAAVANGGAAIGVSLGAYADGVTATFAGAGDVIDVSSVIGTAAEWTYVIADTDGHLVRSGAPGATDRVVGIADREGNLRVNPSIGIGGVAADPSLFNIVNYGAIGTGVFGTEAANDAAFEAAIEAVRAAPDGSRVYIPNGTYKTSKPVTHIGMNYRGILGESKDLAKIQCIHQVGPCLFVGGDDTPEIPLVANLFTGAGFAWNQPFTGLQTDPYFSLSECKFLDFEGKTQCSIQMTYKPTTTLVGARMSLACTAREFSTNAGDIYHALGQVDAAGALFGRLNINGDQYIVQTANGTVVVDTPYHFELHYNGAAIYMHVNGVVKLLTGTKNGVSLGAAAFSHAAAGNLKQPRYASWSFGKQVRNLGECGVGFISDGFACDSIWFSKIARRTTATDYPTVPTAKWTLNDTNTLLGINFDVFHGEPDGVGGYKRRLVKTYNGAAAASGASPIGWMHLRQPAYNATIGNRFTGFQVVCGGGGGTGVFAQGTLDTEFDIDVWFFWHGMSLWNNCYLSNVSNCRVFGAGVGAVSGSIGVMLSEAAHGTILDAPHVTNFNYDVVIVASTATILRPYLTGSACVAHIHVYGEGTNMALRVDSMGISDEESNYAGQRCGIFLDDVKSAIFVGGNIEVHHNALADPPAVLINGGASTQFNGVAFVLATGTPQVFEFGPTVPVNDVVAAGTRVGAGAAQPWTTSVTGRLRVPDLDTQKLVWNFAADANYTITGDQNLRGTTYFTDTGVLLTVGRTVTMPNLDGYAKNYVNGTLQTLTIKTTATVGAGVAIATGAARRVLVLGGETVGL